VLNVSNALLGGSEKEMKMNKKDNVALVAVAKAETVEDFAVAIKDVSSSALLELRLRAFEEALVEAKKPPEQVEISETEVGEMTVFAPVLAAESVEMIRQMLASLDAEIHARQLWPWSDEVAAVSLSEKDFQKVFAGGMHCMDSSPRASKPKSRTS
jgi:hypothetical protein